MSLCCTYGPYIVIKRQLFQFIAFSLLQFSTKSIFSFRQILPAIGPFLRRGCKYVCPAVRIVANAATTVYSGTTSGTYTPVRSVSNFSSSCLRLQFLIFFGFAFDLVAVVVTSFCVGVPHFMHIGPVTTHSGDDVLSIFKMAAAAAQYRYYFQFVTSLSSE